MPILDRQALSHYGVRREGRTQPLCASWGATWNWTLVAADVTCPRCRVALAAPAPPTGATPAPARQA